MKDLLIRTGIQVYFVVLATQIFLGVTGSKRSFVTLLRGASKEEGWKEGSSATQLVKVRPG